MYIRRLFRTEKIYMAKNYTKITKLFYIYLVKEMQLKY